MGDEEKASEWIVPPSNPNKLTRERTQEPRKNKGKPQNICCWGGSCKTDSLVCFSERECFARHMC